MRTPTMPSAGSNAMSQPLLGAEKPCAETPLGDPRRRPRWGVPCRLDIHRLHIDNIQLWVLDLLTMDVHRTAQQLNSDTTRIDVKSMTISRTRLESGDDRKQGSADGVRGVFLGELVWTIVAEVIPIVLKRAPGAFTRTAALAAGYMVKDTALRIGAHAFQRAVTVGHNIKEAVHNQHASSSSSSPLRTLRNQPVGVRVHLIGGRQVTRKGRSVNSHALLELIDSGGHCVAQARSGAQMWSKVPQWDEHFELIPTTHARGAPTYWTVRVALYHQKSRQVVGITHHRTKETPDRFIGEILVPIKALLIQDPVIAKGGEIVGWFPLTDARDLRQGIPCSGELKIGFCVDGAERQEGSEHSQLLHKVSSGFAVLSP